VLKLPLKLIERFFVIINPNKRNKLLDVITLQENTKVGIFGVCLVEEGYYQIPNTNEYTGDNQVIYIIDMVTLLPIIHKSFYCFIKFISFSSWGGWYRGIGLVHKEQKGNVTREVFTYVQLEEFLQALYLNEDYSYLILNVEEYEDYIHKLQTYFMVYSNLKRISIFNFHRSKDSLLKVEEELEKDMLRLMDNYYKKVINHA
jgi:hypothetical protein